MDGEWGDWIALWRLTSMLNIPVALVSSLGEAGLKIINPNAHDEDTGDLSLWSVSFAWQRSRSPFPQP